LAQADDAEIRGVLDDYEAHLWDGVEPRELLVTIMALAELMRRGTLCHGHEKSTG